MSAEFRIVARQLDDGTADEAGFDLAHTFGLWVDDTMLLKCSVMWDGSWWGACKEYDLDPKSDPHAGPLRQALLMRLELVRQVAADPETEVLDLCG